MLSKDMNKSEIEKFLEGKGDFVQIDHLSRFLESNLPLDKKRFICEKLADLYEKRGMFADAAKMHSSIAINSIAFAQKINHHIKEAELCIKAGNFQEASDATKKAMGEASSQEKESIYVTIKSFYKTQAEVYEKQLKRANAVRIYERLLEMNLSDGERKEIKKKLLPLYDKLGRVKEYFALKRE